MGALGTVGLLCKSLCNIFTSPAHFKGISENLVAEALKQTNNDQEAARAILQNPEMIESLRLALTPEPITFQPTDEQLRTLMSLGDYSIDLAFGTLRRTKGNMEEAAELLLIGKGNFRIMNLSLNKLGVVEEYKNNSIEPQDEPKSENGHQEGEVDEEEEKQIPQVFN